MASIKWDESISVGIDEIDQQHQKLILTIQKLEDSAKKQQSKSALKEVLKELTEYLDFHFKTEERIFKIINYPEAETHRKEHVDFVRKITKFKSDYEADSAGLTANIIIFLGDWARNHLKKEDKKYADFIAKQQ